VDPLLGRCSLPELRQRRSFKWQTYPSDVLPAFVAEMDFDLAEPIIAAVTAAMARSDCGYGHKGELGEAFAAFCAARLGWRPDPEQVFAIPDVMAGLAEVIAAVTLPGSGIVVNTPVYPPFLFRFGFNRRRIVEAPLARDGQGRYHLDGDAIEAAVRQPGVAAYVLCSPHNPTGNVWPAEDLAMVASICQRHGIKLCVDEIHAPLVLPGARFVPFLSLGGELTRGAYVFSSASKGWNIPGLKCGVAVITAPGDSQMLSERWEALLPANVGVLASVGAFTQGLPWLDAAIGQIDENRALLTGLLERHLPQVGYVPPQASFLAWLDCRELGLGDDPAAAFLAKGRLAVGRGPDFGSRGRGFVRLNMGTSPSLLAEAVRRMAASVSGGSADHGSAQAGQDAG
jgi:cysteine-S-conjugate beta-lyase